MTNNFTRVQSTGTKQTARIYFVLIFVIVVVLWVLCWYLVSNNIHSTKESVWAARGQFGDMFGAVNALFSGLAFAGIIVTILLQREELALQRQELAATRAEFSEQNKTLKRQRFETRFFNLLSALTYEAQNLDVRRTDVPIGRKAFNQISFLFVNELGRHVVYTEDELDEFRERYKRFIKSFEPVLSVYLEQVKLVYEFVKLSTLLDDADRIFYFQILKAQISFYEKQFFFYYITLKQDDIFVRLEKDLVFISTIPTESFIHPSHELLNRTIDYGR